MAYVSGQPLSASALNTSLPIWQNYTPVWSSSGTAPSLGNGSLIGRYVRVENMVHFALKLVIGSTTTIGTGSYLFTLPATAVASNRETFTGIAADGTIRYPLIAYLTSTSLIALIGTAGTAPVSNTAPFTPNTGDYYTVNGTYEAAA